MWKFQNFSATPILREINFSKCSTTQHVSLAVLDALKFDQIDFT